MLRACLLVYPFLALYTVLGAAVGLPYAWLTRDIRLLYWLARSGVRLALGLSGVRVKLVGREHAFSRPTAVFVSNHVSNLDAPALFMVLPRIAVILKKELSRIPLLGYIMHLGGFIYVDRTRADSRHQALANAVAALRGGLSLLIFPEGTRSRDGRMLPFRPGPFTMAIESQRPIVPISVHGTRELMRKGSLAIKPGRIAVVFHAAIDTEGMTSADSSALMERTRIAIQSALDGPDPLKV
jgi:1-acyl-sn-glycerol-3-phosphate acyltransferase